MDTKKQKSSKRPEAIDHAKFVQLLTDEFPEVPQGFDRSSKDLRAWVCLALAHHEASRHSRGW